MNMDRRRINGPVGGTITPNIPLPEQPYSLQKIFLKTSLTPPSHGSAFLELTPGPLKLTSTVYGPHSLPPSAPFSAQARLSTELKFAAFAAPERKGYVRDPGEREVGGLVQAALGRSILSERYPKSGIEVFVEVLDTGASKWEDARVLAGAINVGSAALVEAGVEMVDLVTGGVAGLDDEGNVVGDLVTGKACVAVGYMAGRDEITCIWSRGSVTVEETEKLMAKAVEMAREARLVVNQAVAERLLLQLEKNKVST